MPINISGDLSKIEVGLIVIILMAFSGTILTVGTNDKIAYSFLMFALVGMFIFGITYIINFFDKKKDLLSDYAPIIEQAELLNLVSSSPLTHQTLIHIYEQLYFRALKEKNSELAEGFKNKIEELKMDWK